jgi:acetyltransferase-like isoleucine patch superfamily enzyme
MNSLLESLRSILRPAVRRVKDFLYQPRRVRMGEGSRIQRPYTLMFPERLSIGKFSRIHSHAYITPLKEYAGAAYTPEIKIGNGVYIGRYAYFVAIDSIVIEDGCVLSEYVYITDNSHGLHPERGPIMKQHLESKGPVHIGQNCFLGFRASIMSGVTLGEHCVVGATRWLQAAPQSS